jgi:hypothetical protein
MKSYFCSNPDRPSKIQGLGNVFSILPASVRIERREAPWPGPVQAQARAVGHQTRRGLIVHDLEDKGNQFCKLTTKETVDGERATAAQFNRCLAMVRVASSGALASRRSSTALPFSPQPPPWVNCFGHR